MTWQVITGDCLEVMPTLEAGSIDAILTDLPYGTTACSWDSVIPFEPMWAAIKHVLKPRGVFVTTASQPFTSALVMSNPKWFKYELVWKKTRPSGFLHAKNKPLKTHENIVVFSAAAAVHASQTDNRMTYNPQKSPGKPYVKRSDPKVNLAWSNMIRPSTKDVHTTINRGDRYPTSVHTCSNDNHNSIHATQKPVALYEYLIRTYTNEGETVLDMTAGSGTTGVAAINTGRNVILIEQREDYADIARRRCAEAAEQAQQMELAIG